MKLFSPDVSEGYRGRFAPSPSGDLHFGSLIAALASYLDARAHQGKWLLRIEDIDPPREVAGATSSIQHTLDSHGLHWDEAICYQSQQSQQYEQVLDWLQQQQLSYHCRCTRKQIQQAGGTYSGHCRQLGLGAEGCSTRFKNHQPVTEFNDGLLGQVHLPADMACEDFIIKRKDGLYAYHLAVVTDDIRQGITHIVRGSDLLEPTACQLALYKTFQQPQPHYLHLPVAVTAPGKKLSKQNHAQALKAVDALLNLYQALQFLQQPLLPFTDYANTEALLNWAVQHWQTTLIAKTREIAISKAD